MKVKITNGIASARRTASAGAILEMEEAEALPLVSGGYAIALDEDTVKEPEPETATAPPAPEHATAGPDDPHRKPERKAVAKS